MTTLRTFGTSRRYGQRLAAWVAVLVLASESGAQASGTTDPAAQAFFDEGRRLMTEGAYERACEKFADSERLDPAPGTLLNLAACYDKLGRRATAWLTYKEAAESADREGRAEWSTRAKEKAAALYPTLSTVTIIVGESEVPGLQILRDGVTAERVTWGSAVPIDGGPHRIVATAPGFREWATSITLPQASGALRLTIPRLERVDDPESRPLRTPSGDPDAAVGRPQITAGVIVGAVGILGFGVGTYFGLHAASLKGDAEPHCSSGFARCDAEGFDAFDSAKSAASVSTVAFIAGATLTTAGAILYFTAPRGRARSVNDVRAGVGAGTVRIEGSF